MAQNGIQLTKQETFEPRGAPTSSAANPRTVEVLHETERGLIFNVQRFSIHDGPGIRTVVFMKGCPLRCRWCDNPESQKFTREIMFFEKKCIACGTCIETCQNDAINATPGTTPYERINRELCDVCGACVKRCPASALQMAGKRMTSDEVMAEVLKDVRFYERSKGGVTLSGGEALAQPDFSIDILRKSHRRNIHTAIETSGYAEWSTFEKVIEHTDLLLYDIKHMDSEIHRTLTGVPNTRILENLEKAVKLRPVVVRIPLIPTYNDSEENAIAVRDFARRIGIREINLLPFHQLGRDKYDRLNMEYELRDLKPATPQADGKDSTSIWREILNANGFIVKVGG